MRLKKTKISSKKLKPPQKNNKNLSHKTKLWAISFFWKIHNFVSQTTIPTKISKIFLLIALIQYGKLKIKTLYLANSFGPLS